MLKIALLRCNSTQPEFSSILTLHISIQVDSLDMKILNGFIQTGANDSDFDMISFQTCH